MIFLITEEQHEELEKFKLQRKIEILQDYLKTTIFSKYSEILCSIKLFPHLDSSGELQFIVYVGMKEKNDILGPRLVSWFRTRQSILKIEIRNFFVRNLKKEPEIKFEIVSC